jgi:hypothetical protein
LINKGKENINSSARCPPPFPRSDSSLVRESDSGVREGAEEETVTVAEMGVRAVVLLPG